MEGVMVTSRDRHSYNENINCLIGAFKQMKKLKILIVEGYGEDFYRKVNMSEFQESFGMSIVDNHLPSSLRWLDFSYYHLFSLPESFHASKLVGFHLPHSSLKTCTITKVILTQLATFSSSKSSDQTNMFLFHLIYVAEHGQIGFFGSELFPLFVRNPKLSKDAKFGEIIPPRLCEFKRNPSIYWMS